MRSCVPLVFVALALALPVGTLAENEESPPPWAYPVNPPDWKPGPDDGSIRRVPESTAGFTLTQLRDLFLAPDWHPGDHPPMPEVVARGRKPDVMACGVCHRADGPGGPENSSLAGLPKAYIVRQMTDFKSGARTTSVPERLPSKLMIALSKGATDAEVDAAAGYFSALKQRANIRVLDEAERRKADRRRHGDARRIRHVVGAVIATRALAMRRVSAGVAPATKGRESATDCLIVETYLHVSRLLRAGGFDQAIVFVTTNTRDFTQDNPNRLHEVSLLIS